jgi:cysteinyl-tRNA synthetase
VRLYNTLTRKVEELQPLEPGKLRLYTCGPTVYNYAHIGNLRTYISEDFIKRAFRAAGFEVRHVMNVTDVGHLQHDTIEAGADKMTLAAEREHKDPWQIARFYEEAFLSDCKDLNIEPADVVCRATDHIQQMIDFVRDLEAKGYTYEVEGNVYFSVDKFPDYGKLALLDMSAEQDARVEADHRKRNPRDFVLWFGKSKFPNQIMKWDSPWGVGFPGWHIECSAMGLKYLGERVDLHMGGIDHIPVHHTNEVAQSDAKLGHRWVNAWVHCNFLVIDDAKMAKSGDNFLRLHVLKDRGFEPAHYRYFVANASYRKELSFSFEALGAAREAFETLKNLVVAWKHQSAKAPAAPLGEKAVEHQQAFWNAVWDDCGVAEGLGTVWKMARDSALKPAEKLALMSDFDRVLGFAVAEMRRPKLPDELMALVREREEARAQKDWPRADALRKQLSDQGIALKDEVAGTDWYRVY